MASSAAKGCPGHSGNCFVGGTQVIVKSGARPLVAFVGADILTDAGSASNVPAVLMIGAGIAMAIAKAKLQEDDESMPTQVRKRPRRRTPENAPGFWGIDEIDENLKPATVVRSGSQLQFAMIPPVAPRAGRRRGWLLSRLSAAMLVWFAIGGWHAIHAFGPSHTATAVAASSLAVPDYVTKNIEEIEEGDLVLARDEHGNEIGWKPVVAVYRRTSFHLRHLVFRDSAGVEQELQTTDEHPFLVADTNEFVEAGKLKPGQEFLSPDGPRQRLVHTYREEHPEGVRVFNFQVEGFHTYFVAQTNQQSAILVHNANNAYGATAASESSAAATSVKTHGHHSDPKFMGGDPKQRVTDIPVPEHKGLHSDLNDFLKGKADATGNHMRPQRGNSGADIQQNFTRQERLNALADFYKKFRSQYAEAAQDFFKQHPHLE